jgi:hypothetical protein
MSEEALRPGSNQGLTPRAKRIIERGDPAARPGTAMWNGASSDGPAREYDCLGRNANRILARSEQGYTDMLSSFGSDTIATSLHSVSMGPMGPMAIAKAQPDAGYENAGSVQPAISRRRRSRSLDPVIGRDNEIQSVINPERRTKNNPFDRRAGVAKRAMRRLPRGNRRRRSGKPQGQRFVTLDLSGMWRAQNRGTLKEE